jgi:hypothetical protein
MQSPVAPRNAPAGEHQEAFRWHIDAKQIDLGQHQAGRTGVDGCDCACLQPQHLESSPVQDAE